MKLPLRLLNLYYMPEEKKISYVRRGALVAVVAVFAAYFLIRPHHKIHRDLAQISPKHLLHREISRDEVAKLMGERRISSRDLELDFYPLQGNKGEPLEAKLTLDRELQSKIEELYKRYDPSYAAFVALDPETGKILAMVDHTSEEDQGNLNLQASFPAASVFKVITSAAALGEGKLQPRDRLPVNGSYSTLYKSNLRDTVNRWTRFISIEEAFAKSVNTVFGRIAMKRVGTETMQKYADSFGFNQKIPFDMPLELGIAHVPEDDEYGLAESGSGFTRKQTLNPIQGALIAAAVINQGKIAAPYLVESISKQDGTVMFEHASNPALFHPIEADTAKSLSAIMEHTITQGTARKEFRDYNHHPVLSNLFIGAKTGSLTGYEPFGKYDWFVGFAQSSSNPKQKIAFASMIVNRKYWRVKSSRLAREAIIHYFKARQGT